MAFSSDFDRFRRQMNQLMWDMDRSFASLQDDWFNTPLLESEVGGQQQLLPQGSEQKQQLLGSKDDMKSQGGDKQLQVGSKSGQTSSSDQQLQQRDGLGSSLIPFSTFSPFQARVDVIEGKDKYEVHAELPGLQKSDIQLNIDPATNSLTLSGESKRSVEHTSDDRRYVRSERSYGSFRRTLKLPHDVDQSKIAARYDNGVLLVDLPRLQQDTSKSQARQLQIQ